MEHNYKLHFESNDIFVRSTPYTQRRHAVQNGSLWTESVADYMLTMYPDLLEYNEDGVSMLRLIQGKLYL